jgi:hypothetical protein
MEAALNSLAETDEEIALLHTNRERAEIMRKRVRQREFMYATGTVAERTAIAEGTMGVGMADDEYIAALQAYESLKAKRQTWMILIEVWRSVNAGMRKGNI